MKKEIKKPFDIRKAMNGAKVKTESGHDVEILKWNARGTYPIIGFVKYNNVDKAEMWDKNGFFYNKDVSTKDLVIIEEIEESERWIDNKDAQVSGYCIGLCGCISEVGPHTSETYWIYPHIFATEKQAKSALAMARISQIIKNDERFGGRITDKEWKNRNVTKFVIRRMYDDIICDSVTFCYNFLSFHTEEQAKLFLEENERIVKDYLMLD